FRERNPASRDGSRSTGIPTSLPIASRASAQRNSARPDPFYFPRNVAAPRYLALPVRLSAPPACLRPGLVPRAYSPSLTHLERCIEGSKRRQNFPPRFIQLVNNAMREHVGWAIRLSASAMPDFTFPKAGHENSARLINLANYLIQYGTDALFSKMVNRRDAP